MSLEGLILPILRLKFHPKDKDAKASKPCHVGIHFIAVIEYSQMSTHVPGFQSFFRVCFASFCIGQISHH